MNKKEIIGLTGEPCSGKSLISQLLSKNSNINIINSDKVSKEILLNSESQEKIIKIFGTKPSISEIAKIIFSSPKKKKDLEGYIHPLVWQNIDDIVSQNIDKINIVESAIIYETHNENRFKKIILAICSDPKVQAQRAMDRGWSEFDYQTRLNSQFPSEYKRKRANFVIDTNCSLSELEKRVDILYQSF